MRIVKSPSKYKLWTETQSIEFLKYVHGNKIPENFKDNTYKAISLIELELLDNKFINDSESHTNPEGK